MGVGCGWCGTRKAFIIVWRRVRRVPKSLTRPVAIWSVRPPCLYHTAAIKKSLTTITACIVFLKFNHYRPPPANHAFCDPHVALTHPGHRRPNCVLTAPLPAAWSRRC